MGFTIINGGPDWLGTLLILAGAAVVLISVLTLVTAAKQARDATVEAEGDDIDLIA